MKKNFFISLILIITFALNYVFYNRLHSPCSILPQIHNFILYEVLAIFLFLFFAYFINIKKILTKNLYMILLGILLIIIKVYLFYISDIQIDIIYLLKIFLSIFIELIPLILLNSLLKNKYKWITILSVVGILLLNISSAAYFYNTNESIEPIIFSNFNLISIKGFFLDYSIIEIISLILILLLTISILFIAIKKTPTVTNPIQYLLGAIITFSILLILYHTANYIDKNSLRKRCQLYGYIKVAKDKKSSTITSNSLVNFIDAYWHYSFPPDFKTPQKYIKLTDKELKDLKKIGLIQNKVKTDFQQKKYSKVILIVIESLSIDAIHRYNKKIPKEASFYFDNLLNDYFHLNNFYTSNMPTDYGMTALLKSKIDLNINSQSLYTVLQKNGYHGYYMVAISKYYGRMASYYLKAFGFQNYINAETLEKEYGHKQSGWGFHDDILFDKAFKILEENKDKKVFLTIKEIDFHQPGAYCGLKTKELPKSVQNSNRIVKSIYWINYQVKNFIDRLKKNNLLDNQTLIILTADHNPHLAVYYEKYALKDNFLRLAKIPMIFITKNQDFRNMQFLENNLYSQIDLAPTLTTLLGLKSNNDFMGKNIFNTKTTHNAILGKYKNELYLRTKRDLQKIDLVSDTENNQTVIKFFKSKK